MNKTKSNLIIRFSLSVLFLLVVFSGSGSKWVGITNSSPLSAKITLVSSNVEQSRVHLTLAGFNLQEVVTPNGLANIPGVKKGSRMEVSGAPDLPKLTASLVIPDNAAMELVVIASTYKDYPEMNIAPSKGILSRNIDPSAIPYQYGPEYSRDAFYPGSLTGTRNPYILRDLRGQTIIVYPFQYNPVTKVLRVYYDITVEFRKVSELGINPMSRNGKEIRINKEFQSIYSRHFLNYDSTGYIPLNDYGNILVISYGSFMAAMQPYINWKRSIGFPTTMVSIDSVGSTPVQIKQFITNYYNTKGLTFVLLVGDELQVPTYEGTGVGGPSDNYYGYLAGNDHYADAFIGRFSAETVDQVNTQVQRTLDYEKNPQFRTNNWMSTVIGIGSALGPGDNNEYDYQHIRNQQSKLLNYTYTWNPELFDGSQGGNDAAGNPVPADVTTAVNAGASLILYCGHGSMTSWGTTGFNNTNVNTLTNQGKLPFIWSVACVNGEFMDGTCFAEAWLRATQNNQPTGALAFFGSTINQSWNSPMAGQDEMTDILAESYPNNIKHTFAGISLNGCMKMIDEYGTDGENMADTWTVFGDPSVMVRTKNPDTLIVSNATTLLAGTTSLPVTCNENGARATLTLHDTILATSIVNNNIVLLTFPALVNPSDTLLLTVTDYNSVPYLSQITIIAPVTADFTGTPLKLHAGGTVTFSDHSSGNPVTWRWSFPGGIPDSSILQNPVITYPNKGNYDVRLIASNGLSSDTLDKINYIETDYPNGIYKNSTNLNLSISPNPGNGIFNIKVESLMGDRIDIRIFNSVGTEVFNNPDFAANKASGTVVDLSGFSEGVYFLKVQNDSSAIMQKIVIQK